jgi:hypothetical protein
MKTGIAHNRTDHRDYSYHLALLEHRHLDAVLTLQEEVLATLRDHETFAPSSPESLSRDFGLEGFTIGMFIDQSLFGYMSLHWIRWDLDRDDELKLEQVVHLPREELFRVVRFRHTALHPDFHGGNSMMKKMGSALLETAARSVKPPRYLASLHSPKNYPSLKYPFANGMLAIKLIRNRLGMYRLLCFRDLEHSFRVSSEENLFIEGTDETGLIQGLNRGYYGYGLHRQDGSTLILFGKPERPITYPWPA